MTRRALLRLASAVPARTLLAADGAVQIGKYVHLVNASTNQTAGVPFRLSTALLRLALTQRYRGKISFRSTDSNAKLPPPYEFSAKDDLYESHLFDVTLRSPGAHTVTVVEDGTGREFPSNVILASERVPRFKLYFGDIHIHSAWSPDGRNTPDYSYVYARDAMNLDFACLTEHDPTDEIWTKIKAKAKELYQPGRFATMSAYEWTAHRMGEGHKNVYYRDWEAPLFRSNYREDRTAQTNSAADLWAKLRASGKTAITIPHHPASVRFPVPWDHYDPEFQKCVEIYSTWGSSEYPGSPRQINDQGGSATGHFVQDALERGQRVGFVGASDSHSGRPGYPANTLRYFETDYSEWMPQFYTGGFTGIYAEELSREAVFDAIRSRRCYATTARRIIVDFKADGHWMGEEYSTNDAPHLSVHVIGTAPLASVTVVKNNRNYIYKQPLGAELRFEFGETEPPRELDFYYLRVIQVDGEMAWSSPIWIERKSR